ncbi:MAG: hypothetical protein ACT4PE_12060 [Candidatus Eiseniibacteriota bacterium]
MAKLVARVLGMAAALGALLPSASEAGKSLNHNQILLRAGVFALAAALGAFLPGASEAGRSLNHSQTILRS